MNNIKLLLKGRQVFDENLSDAVVRSNDFEIFCLALERGDCPAGLLVDLSQSPNSEVREAVARHQNLPLLTKERLARDPIDKVAQAARRNET